ncbi:MAG: CHAP domain-containing protein, partial [Lachnospiraceae bacterium]|nr:CHAP domain-containing protein [Lachnospiraceae bacterium]
MTPIEKLLATAQAEEGYLEKASNSQLDNPAANAGQNNWTKYARDLDALGRVYNGKKNGYAWCDVFVDWC